LHQSGASKSEQAAKGLTSDATVRVLRWTGVHSLKNESASDSNESETLVEQPSPEVCS